MTSTTLAAQQPAAPPAHRRRRPTRPGVPVALALALAAAGVLLALPRPQAPRPAGAEWSLAEAYPRIRPAATPGYTEDGWAYQPLLFLDARTSIGTATAPDLSALKLIIWAPGTRERSLRTLSESDSAQFSGLVTDGGHVAWLEQTAGADGQGDTRIWIADRTGTAPARQLTTDTGDFVFFGSMHDMVITGGRLSWVAATPGRTGQTEIRSVPLTGGPVDVRTVPGSYALAGGGWLVSAVTGQTDTTRLYDPATARRTDVPVGSGELVSCSPAWCRVLVLTGGTAEIDVMRPDGSTRGRAAEGAVTAALVDVGVLDRWEVYSRPGHGPSELSSQQLLLYDLREHRSIVVADGVGQVLCRGGVVFWSTGQGDTLTWYALDLAELA